MSAHGHRPPATPNPPIANEINAATKQLHTELNKAIIERLPLALPPHTQSPVRYAIGIRRFAAVFLAFEAEFSALKERQEEDKHKEAVRQWVVTLLPPGLQRSSRLQDDLKHLQQVYKSDMSDCSPDEYAKISRLVRDKPHVLVAYAWIMYMAIFSGGRWIRQQLAAPGSDFWMAKREQESDILGFSFLSFDEANDGEGLKAAFKKRLEHADGLLTEEERQDIVNTGQDLFEYCIQLIERIDRDVWWVESRSKWPLGSALLLVGLLWILWRVYHGQSVLSE